MTTLVSTTRFHGAETSLTKYQESCLSEKLGVGLGVALVTRSVGGAWCLGSDTRAESPPGCWCLWLRPRRGIAIAAVSGAVTTLLVGLVTNACHSMRTLTTSDIHG
jgi:hypothetical protein